MKKNIIGGSSGKKNTNSTQNLFNPQMLEMFSNMMKNNQSQKKEETKQEPKQESKQEPKKSEEKKENTKPTETKNTVDDELPTQMQLIYNKQLADIIKNHDKISRRLNRRQNQDSSAE